MDNKLYSYIGEMPSAINKLFQISLIIIAVAVIAVRLFFLNKGMIFSDDAWYATLLRDTPQTNEPTRFFLLFKYMPTGNIFFLRLFIITLLLGSVLFFGFSIYRYMKVKKANVSLWLCLSSPFIAMIYVPVIQTPNYIIINQIIGLISTGLLLLFLTNKKSWILLIISFILSFLFASQITCLSMLPAFYAVVLINAENKVKDTIYFVVGGILFIIYYLLFVESLSDIFNFVKAQTVESVDAGSGDYGIGFLKDWLIVAICYYAKYIVGALLCFILLKLIDKHIHHSIIAAITSFISILVVFKYTVGYILPVNNESFLYEHGIIWIILFYLLIKKRGELDKASWSVVFLCILMPLMLSFGTNVQFHIRQVAYLSLVAPFVIVLLKPSIKVKAVLLLALVALCFQFEKNLNGKNWFGDVYLDQTNSVSSIGIDQNVKVSISEIERLKYVKTYLKDGEECFLSNKCWGYVYLLNLKPLSYSFRLPEEVELVKNISDYLVRNKCKEVPLLLDDGYEEKYRSLLDNSKIKVRDVTENKGIHIYMCSLND